MGELPNASIPGPHVPQNRLLQISNHRLSTSCGVVETWSPLWWWPCCPSLMTLNDSRTVLGLFITRTFLWLCWSTTSSSDTTNLLAMSTVAILKKIRYWWICYYALVNTNFSVHVFFITQMQYLQSKDLLVHLIPTPEAADETEDGHASHKCLSLDAFNENYVANHARQVCAQLIICLIAMQ